MSGRSLKLIVIATVLLLAVGCLVEFPLANTPNRPAVTTEQPAPETSPGTLAVMGADGNLYLTTRDGAPIALTDDGDLTSPTRGIANGSPVWSPDGWLAFVRTEASRQTQTMTVYAFPPGITENPVQVEQQAAAYAYGYWASAPCDEQEPCGIFSFLTSDPEGINFNAAEVTPDGARSAIWEQSEQHYFSWAPDGQRMLWFRDQTDLTIHNMLSHSTETEFGDITPGVFQAPAWSPVDDRLLIAQARDEDNQLTIIEGNTLTEIGPALPRNAAFAWSPDGNLIALGGNGYPMSQFFIIDVKTGDADAFESLTDVTAFFWSPNSTSIAVLTIAPEEAPLIQAEAARLARLSIQTAPHTIFQWQIIDVASGQIEAGPEFVPTLDEQYFVQFFEQFGQSHRVWSPDSQAVTYAERVIGQNPRVLVYDTTDPGSAPVVVMEGSFSVYAFQ